MTTKLKNLIPNSNFSEFKYDNTTNRPNTITLKDWIISSEQQINGSTSFRGGYSINLKTSSETGGATLTAKLTERLKDDHLYYFRVYYRLADDAISSNNIMCNLGYDIVSLFKNLNINNIKNKDWDFTGQVMRLKDVDDTRDVSILIKQNDTSGKNNIIIDSLLMIDLSAAFGYMREPSLDWCNNCIPYFETTYDMDKEPIDKNVEYTCMDSLFYNEKINTGYISQYALINSSPKITFTVKNADKMFNTTFNPITAMKIYMMIDCYKNNKFIKKEYIYYSEIDIKFKDNNAYCTYSYLKNKVLDANDQLLYDMINITAFTDSMFGYGRGRSMKIQLVRQLDSLKDFTYNLQYNLSYASTYLRKLTGTTCAYTDVPVNVKVLINGMETSPVHILNKDNNPMQFEKELYLTDGNNDIEVIISDMFGNKLKKTSKIYVDCMTPTPEKKDLLENFIADDDLNISLHLGNSDLKYNTKSAGMDKDITIDTSIQSHYFELSGKNANLYRISKDNIPKIQGDIIKRPLTIVFDSVEKIYDGKSDITDQLRQLHLDNGYYLSDVHKEYNDFVSSGLVREIKERRITSKVLCNPYEEIQSKYELEESNIDFNNVRLEIDGHVGYTFLDEITNKALIIMDWVKDSSNPMNNIFKEIYLERNNDKTILSFIYMPDVNKYKVESSVNIKYNYSDNSSNNYTVYRNSDVGFVDIDFNTADLEYKDVTDELLPININGIKFISGPLGDASNNYQIANYTATGRILRRTVDVHIECLNKYYDGTVIVPFKSSTGEKIYNGLYDAIEGDDVYIDNKYSGTATSKTHYYEYSGNSKCVCESPDVGENKDVVINSLFLEGEDAKNYKIGNIISNYKTTIWRRPVNVVINKLKFIRSTKQWQVDYTILNDIADDSLTICYNTNDEFDIKVYGGIDKNGNSIHKEYAEKLDIISMFFNYPFNRNYQFKDNSTEVELVESTKNTAYWRNEARVAEPDTERIDITTTHNTDYPGEIKQSLDSTLTNGVETSYFESQSKDYKLYSGCKVMVTNINLNPLNNKTKNYTLENSTYETEIEII